MVKYVYHNCFIPVQRLYGLVPVYIIRRLFRKFFKAEKCVPLWILQLMKYIQVFWDGNQKKKQF